MKKITALLVCLIVAACEPMKEEVHTSPLSQEKKTHAIPASIEQIEAGIVGKTWVVDTFEYLKDQENHASNVDTSFIKTFEFTAYPNHHIKAVYHAEVYDTNCIYQIAAAEERKIIAMMLNVAHKVSFLKEFEIVGLDSTHLYLYERQDNGPDIYYVMRRKPSMP
ncbi:MAG TPA: hypothetical protein VL947_13005 [Cytophagales bacterium]|nr:hypothetical protein [Cytophagales bacterium]